MRSELPVLPKTFFKDRTETLEDPQLTNIHEALAAASSASRASTEVMKNFSVRMTEGLKNATQAICQRNATDLGTYLRECAKALARDYGHDLDDES